MKKIANFSMVFFFLILIPALGGCEQNKDASIQTSAEMPLPSTVDELRVMAKSGDVRAQAALAKKLLRIGGTKENFNEGVKWAGLAADKGNPLAQYLMGTSYFYGRGALEDDEEAYKWFKKSAEQGFANAHHQMGEMFFNGYYVKKDSVQAVGFWREAIALGSPLAMSGMAVSYFNPSFYSQNGYLLEGAQLTEKDDIRALMLVTVASHLWDEDFDSDGLNQKNLKKFSEKIAASMSQRQITEAKKLARECQARNFKGC